MRPSNPSKAFAAMVRRGRGQSLRDSARQAGAASPASWGQSFGGAAGLACSVSLQPASKPGTASNKAGVAFVGRVPRVII
jgi:hypothetical protein